MGGPKSGGYGHEKSSDCDVGGLLMVPNLFDHLMNAIYGGNGPGVFSYLGTGFLCWSADLA